MIATAYITEVRKLTDAARQDGLRVGFVPTMGALHEGHATLVRRAREECGFVVVSIFVNPTQFGPNEDLSTYPRTFADDLERCAAEGADLVFHPDADEIYPQPQRTTVTLGEITDRMEGAHRPGHFDGVALVCSKLFNIVGGCTAYFGEKDAQQLRVIQQLVHDLAMPVEIVGCPTVREDDGLAMSSRNRYLDATDRTRAVALSAALFAIKQRFDDGERDAQQLVDGVMPLLADMDDIDYLEIVDADTFHPVSRVDGPVVVCGAVRIGTTRLIDNIRLDP